MVNITKLKAEIKKLREQVSSLREVTRLRRHKTRAVSRLRKEKKSLSRELHPTRTKISMLLGKELSKLGKGVKKSTRAFLKEALSDIRSNPVGFTRMLTANKHLTDAQKVKAFKTYIRKHGRRSSTLD